MATRLRQSSAPARSSYISSEYYEDKTQKHEYPAAWRNPLQQWMEHREPFQVNKNLLETEIYDRAHMFIAKCKCLERDICP